MTDRELLVATVILGERLGGVFDFEALVWTTVPRFYVSDISEVSKTNGL